jgi:thiol-disulfide isomerase/thioredoxin
MARGASWSGKERNCLFTNREGSSFENLSGISGLDDIADGRVFSLFDLDRDGWQDVALVNTNAPRFKLFRNTLGDGGRSPNVVALRLQGGNRTARASSEWSHRDGYGALVTVTAGDLVMRRELRCGEGLSAQNSDTLIVGLGPNERAGSVSVRWPSGRVQTLEGVASGTLLSVFEDPDASPTGEAFVTSSYGPGGSLPTTVVADAGPRFELPALKEAGADAPTLRVYTTTATWCANCRAELPQFEHLRQAFDETELGLYGVPYDDSESAELLTAYRDAEQPAYEMLIDLPPSQRRTARDFLTEALGADALPASVVTDDAGTVLLTTWGVPTVSELRLLLAGRGR